MLLENPQCLSKVTVPRVFGQSDMTLIILPRKFSKLMVAQPVPQTDTGSREEYSQVLE
jgi:hypothetical protein